MTGVKSTQQDTQAQIIDGKALASQIRDRVKSGVDELQKNHGIRPGLAVILVGNRVDSQTYVKFKKKAAGEVGIASYECILEEDATEDAIREAIEEFSEDERVHAILVQLPLPAHVDTDAILQMIPPDKDVDGFSALNVGDLWLNSRKISNSLSSGTTAASTGTGDLIMTRPLVLPCTAAGVIQMLHSLKVPLQGKEAVVVGRSRIVGMPVAGLLQGMDCTVTTVHSKTLNLEQYIRRADIVVAAIGKPEFIKADWLKPGAIVIDVGINQKPDNSSQRGYRLVGDVEFQSASQVCSAISPVPGGVGPMTVAMLLQNALNLARNSIGLHPLPMFYDPTA
eukprot:CAMPEP_0184480106 /NCGR_PEP_ID=MMETSP0113_2-20130426/1611_1 /TAXON_ID=91329 /ORGANISM="Norrisiella sphaerica, Strain BC52" /LENGTH=337 /DNA_ID=CAMNT_0026858379 /DNA_START=399 /DNA_END=1412 /DNA_ORIENTATION=-